MSLRKILLEFNIHDSLDEFKQMLDSHNIGIDYDVEYYLGSGQNGDAYKVSGKNKVIKVGTYQHQDYLLLEKIKNQDNLKYVAKIYMNKKIMSKNLLLTVMEFLEQPPEDVQNIPSRVNWTILAELEAVYNGNHYSEPKLKGLIKYLNNTSKEVLESGNNKRFNKLMNQLLNEYSDEKELLFYILFAGQSILPTLDYKENLTYIIKNKKLFKDVLEGIKEFKSFGEIHNDIKIQNILVDPKTKNYKLIDPWVF